MESYSNNTRHTSVTWERNTRHDPHFQIFKQMDNSMYSDAANEQILSNT